MSSPNQEPEIRADREDRPYAPPERASRYLLLLAALLIGGVIAAWLLRSGPAEAPAPRVAAPVQTAPAPTPPASAVATTSPAIQYPLPEPVEQPLRAEEIPAALVQLLGEKAVLSFLQTDNFARRVAATVDSLGREHSPVAAWPVLPMGGRFTVEERADGPVISAENASRYTPFVLLAATLDVQKAAAVYRRMYPLLQQSYRELGFGDRYLNDRVIALIDLLLATPEPAEPPRLQLIEVKGPVPSTRPWVRYQFADPELESLSAGQKILVRVGPVNERRLKTKLAELRQQIVTGGGQAGVTGPAVQASSGPASSPPAAR